MANLEKFILLCENGKFFNMMNRNETTLKSQKGHSNERFSKIFDCFLRKSFQE